METIGDRIKRLRKHYNLTLQEVAEQVNTSKGNISNYETNKIKPSADTIVLLSKLFKVSTDYLLTGEDNVIESKKSGLDISDNEIYILHLYRKLNDINKIKIEAIMEDRISQQKYNFNIPEFLTKR